MIATRPASATGYARIETLAASRSLAIRGAFHPGQDDAAPKGCQTLLLLGPDEPRFWSVFSASPEKSDGAPHPLDRWSKRQAGALAQEIGAQAIYPSDGPPWPPFIAWALASGRNHVSPTGLLVQDQAGLLVSFRAALAMHDRLDLPSSPPSPCTSCAAPCTTACPVGALAPEQDYDIAKCAAHVRSAQGQACRTGCLVRRACPASSRLGRDPAQSAFHMAAFLKGQTCA
ncbi:ferredoxin [Primorskyibacter flagellatus]|uniref:4Fe-4S ferredoxin-type domain-containing protein n=1 Tax=Primorskyibacter flagellatus TaxID=1387277 RepID=A0A1W1ZMD6_9RHOB|nr:ferredoxin [Primorskyibacter flagellatus]SMC49705.1 hypothetical protein SAMN06295998_10215 [Primorskyibacter flagellatus]